jgi:hypothetical protein
MTKIKYENWIIGVIVAWLSFALSASALQLFRNDFARPPVLFILAAVMPVILFLLWYAYSPGLREFALSLDPRTLTLAQAWRINGFIFLALYSYGILPGLFAFPAGWGDISIGTTALLIGAKYAKAQHRNLFIVWQLLGIIDLVVAVSLGATARLTDPHSVPMTAMTILPLSLIPTFIVPLLLIIHIICIAQARRWPDRQTSSIGQQLPSAI